MKGRAYVIRKTEERTNDEYVVPTVMSFKPSGLCMIGKIFSFQQDDPKQSSNLCQNYLKSKNEGTKFLK